ncbi:hypothetical protein AX14_012701 [Amanita brunnescens Koide BX004]|nr:hypothetical protein AX14_012701 [Amanita brunnescens Koide BX004]
MRLENVVYSRAWLPKQLMDTIYGRTTNVRIIQYTMCQFMLGKRTIRRMKGTTITYKRRCEAVERHENHL